MADSVIDTAPLGAQWPMVDPFLFCVHHDDAYPAGNERMGPAASLAGRNLGQDFEGEASPPMNNPAPTLQYPQLRMEIRGLVRRSRSRCVEKRCTFGSACSSTSADAQTPFWSGARWPSSCGATTRCPTTRSFRRTSLPQPRSQRTPRARSMRCGRSSGSARAESRRSTAPSSTARTGGSKETCAG